MLEQPNCKLCGHGFGDHQSNELGSWWCNAGYEKGEGYCPCDQFFIDTADREAMYDKYYLN